MTKPRFETDPERKPKPKLREDRMQEALDDLRRRMPDAGIVLLVVRRSGDGVDLGIAANMTQEMARDAMLEWLLNEAQP